MKKNYGWLTLAYMIGMLCISNAISMYNSTPDAWMFFGCSVLVYVFFVVMTDTEPIKPRLVRLPPEVICPSQFCSDVIEPEPELDVRLNDKDGEELKTFLRENKLGVRT